MLYCVTLVSKYIDRIFGALVQLVLDHPSYAGCLNFTTFSTLRKFWDAPLSDLFQLSVLCVIWTVCTTTYDTLLNISEMVQCITIKFYTLRFEQLVLLSWKAPVLACQISLKAHLYQNSEWPSYRPDILNTPDITTYIKHGMTLTNNIFQTRHQRKDPVMVDLLNIQTDAEVFVILYCE